MRHRQLGRTGLEVSELGLGTWGLSGDGYGPVAEGEQEAVVERARALGITLLDTADSYAHGAMESRLGRLLGAEPSVCVVTKLGTDRTARVPRKRFELPYLKEAFERSVERLGRDPLDVVLLHNPSPTALERDEATGLLAELHEAGRVRAWGVSAGSVEAARGAIRRGAQVLALTYNLLCSRDLRELEGEVDERGVGVLAHSVLAYGLLCGHWSADKQFGEGDHRAERWSADELRLRLRHLDAVRPLVGGEVATLRAAAVRFALSSPRVSSVVLGPRSRLQLDQLVREAGTAPPYLPRDKLGALEARLRHVGAEP